MNLGLINLLNRKKMKLSELKPGQFFEFIQAGYGFGRCMYIGPCDDGYYGFVHQSAALNFFVLNNQVKINSKIHREPLVTVDVPQEWKVYNDQSE